MCLNSCIFNLCLNWLAYFSRVYDIYIDDDELMLNVLGCHLTY